MAKQYDTRQKSNESLEQWYRRLAKTADQRLVRLERLAEQENYATATKWAYARAMRDIKKYGGENASRFNIAPPKNKNQLLSKIADLQTFINAETSTKSGITNVYKKRADTINQKYGTNFTWNELAEYYASGDAQKMSESFGSGTALKVIGEIQKSEEDELKRIAKAGKIHEVVKDDIVADKLQEALADNGLDLSYLK